ncbi:hypothetical protein BDZ91DRAFT_709847 [Kalaharituber pfeilii]|nr:hypothetical protein BDZ91DRAFT_709847 [Kalaharituber pfeilii]
MPPDGFDCTSRALSNATTSATSASTISPSLPRLPLLLALHSHSLTSPAAPALSVTSSPTKATTYSALLSSAANLRSFLLSLSRPTPPSRSASPSLPLLNTRIALLLPPSPEWVTALLAIWATGATAVPLHPPHPIPELCHIVRDSAASLILSTPSLRATAQKVADVINSERPSSPTVVQQTDLPITLPTSDWTWLPEGDSSAQSVAGTLSSTPALLIYTSGTTSLPKGVPTTHLALQTQLTSLRIAWEYSSSDHLLHILPLHHVHGILNCLLVPLSAGAHVELLPGGFNAEAVLKRLASPYLLPDNNADAGNEQSRITLFMAVPTIYTRLINTYTSLSSPTLKSAVSTALSNLRLAVSGSAALPTSVRKDWASISYGGTILERYGMTEVGMAVSCGLNVSLRPEGAVGWPLPGYQIGLRKVESDEAQGERSGTGTEVLEGEVLIRGPGVFTQYWNRPSEVTEKEFLPSTYMPDYVLPQSSSPFSPLPSPLKDIAIESFRWFKTGDFARLLPPSSESSAPSTPPLAILGRLSTDIIKSGGEKISALEIEREILSHPMLSQYISEVAVVGLPDAEWGEVVAAVMVPKAAANEVLGTESVRGLLRGVLAPYKLPKVVRVVVGEGGLKRNAMGKVNKKAVVREVFGGWKGLKADAEGGK